MLSDCSEVETRNQRKDLNIRDVAVKILRPGCADTSKISRIFASDTLKILEIHYQTDGFALLDAARSGRMQ